MAGRGPSAERPSVVLGRLIERVIREFRLEHPEVGRRDVLTAMRIARTDLCGERKDTGDEEDATPQDDAVSRRVATTILFVIAMLAASLFFATCFIRLP